MHPDILNRYDDVITKAGIRWPECVPDPGTDLSHLKWMLEEMRAGRVGGEKAHRWLGFVQGVLIARGLARVNDERDFTRPYFTHTTGASTKAA